MASPNSITPRQLDRLIGTPDCPVIVDVTTDPDFAEAPFLIPGSFRHPHDDIPGLIDRLDGRPCDVTCQNGLKLSQRLVAWPCSDGRRAQYLCGGAHGWRDTPGVPRIPARALPAPVGGATLRVTRHRPRIDRIACPWLIRRFVDPGARFLFVSPQEVAGVERYDATPCDVEDVVFSHTGDQCSPDAMLDAFQLHSPALDRLATVIRAADTDRNDLAPQAAGLTLYDALLRWARDGFDETHNWPGGHAEQPEGHAT